MSKLTIPKNYSSALNLHDTQLAIKTVKDFFQGMLAQRLSLTRVSAPLFVDPTTGLNDNLNGYERPVTFGILEQGVDVLRQGRGGGGDGQGECRQRVDKRALHGVPKSF